jgi:hypothetical protein
VFRTISHTWNTRHGAASESLLGKKKKASMSGCDARGGSHPVATHMGSVDMASTALARQRLGGGSAEVPWPARYLQ